MEGREEDRHLLEQRSGDVRILCNVFAPNILEYHLEVVIKNLKYKHPLIQKFLF
jgi:hypothetical protein